MNLSLLYQETTTREKKMNHAQMQVRYNELSPIVLKNRM